MLAQEEGVGLRAGQARAVDAALLTRADADGLPAEGVADGVGLGVFERDQGDDEVKDRALGQRFVFRHDLAEQLAVDFEIVAALLEGDAEDLLALLRLGHVGRVDLHDVVGAVALAFEQLQGFGRIAGGDDAVGDLALDDPRGGHVAGLGQGDPVAEGAHAVGAPCPRVGAGEGAVVEALDVVDEAGLPQLLVHRQAEGRAARADVLEGGRAGQAGRLLKLPDELPGVEGVEEVDVAGAAGEDLDGQLRAVAHIDLRGLLIGVAAVFEFKFLHGAPHRYLLISRSSKAPVAGSV